jgi:cold shock protein
LAIGRCSLDDAIVSDLPPKSGLWREVQQAREPLSPRVNTPSGLTRRQTMQKGTVKWFNSTKGYGFIKPTTGDKDVFVHISAVERAGLRSLNEGQEVEYELITNRGRTSAENLKVA